MFTEVLCVTCGKQIKQLEDGWAVDFEDGHLQRLIHRTCLDITKVLWEARKIVHS